MIAQFRITPVGSDINQLHFKWLSLYAMLLNNHFFPLSFPFCRWCCLLLFEFDLSLDDDFDIIGWTSSIGAFSSVISIVFNFFLLVFSLKASLELLLCGESSEGAESTPGTQLSSGSSISGAIGR